MRCLTTWWLDCWAGDWADELAAGWHSGGTSGAPFDAAGELTGGAAPDQLEAAPGADQGSC